MARGDQQLKFRVPADLKERLDAASVENHRSLNAEIIARLESSFAPATAQDFEEFKRKSDIVMRVVNEMADEIDRRGIKVPTIRRRFDDYDPSEARKKAIAEYEAGDAGDDETLEETMKVEREKAKETGQEPFKRIRKLKLDD